MRSSRLLLLLGLIICSSVVMTTQPSFAEEKKTHHKKKGRKGHKNGLRHDFSNVKFWSKKFNNPKRTKWQKPKYLMKLMGITPGMRVVDLGAGTGYFHPWLSEAVGPSGFVDATDIAKSLVNFMNQRAKKRGWNNVRARIVKEGTPTLAPRSVDRILIVNTWHHLTDRIQYSKAMLDSLKPGGSVWVVDFTLKSKRGPSRRHKVRPKSVLRELKAAGFQTEILRETLPEQYIVVGRK